MKSSNRFEIKNNIFRQENLRFIAKTNSNNQTIHR